jgi:hypothetical protein
MKNGNQTHDEIDFSRIQVMQSNVRTSRRCLWEYSTSERENSSLESPLTPSNRIHSATSPFLRGLETSEVSPVPSVSFMRVITEKEQWPLKTNLLLDSNISPSQYP